MPCKGSTMHEEASKTTFAEFLNCPAHLKISGVVRTGSICVRQLEDIDRQMLTKSMSGLDGNKNEPLISFAGVICINIFQSLSLAVKPSEVRTEIALSAVSLDSNAMRIVPASPSRTLSTSISLIFILTRARAPDISAIMPG